MPSRASPRWPSTRGHRRTLPTTTPQLVPDVEPRRLRSDSHHHHRRISGVSHSGTKTGALRCSQRPATAASGMTHPAIRAPAHRRQPQNQLTVRRNGGSSNSVVRHVVPKPACVAGIESIELGFVEIKKPMRNQPCTGREGSNQRRCKYYSGRPSDQNKYLAYRCRSRRSSGT